CALLHTALANLVAALSDSLAGGPDVPLSAVEVLEPDVRRRVLIEGDGTTEWNDTAEWNATAAWDGTARGDATARRHNPAEAERPCRGDRPGGRAARRDRPRPVRGAGRRHPGRHGGALQRRPTDLRRARCVGQPAGEPPDRRGRAARRRGGPVHAARRRGDRG